MSEELPEFPAVLGLPLRDDYGLEPDDGILRTEVESGPAIQREEFSQTPSTITVAWRWSLYQYAVFESWYKHVARRGAAWFLIDLESGLGIVAHEARFFGPWRMRRRGVHRLVSARLEVRERPVLSEDALAVALDSDLAHLFQTIDGFHGYVHSTLPGPHNW